MRLTRKDVGDATVLSVEGRMTLLSELDKLNAATTQLAQEGRQKLVLDLSNVTLVDSAGLGELARTFVTLSRQGGTMLIAAPTASLRGSLALTKLVGVFQVYESVDDALLALQSDEATRK